MAHSGASDETIGLCRPFVVALPIAGASVTVFAGSDARLTLCSTDALAARIDELHFELGEGPQWATARTGEMTLIPDVGAHNDGEWPVLGEALRGLPVGALYCVPIQMGAVTLGVATLYCTVPRELTDDQQRRALAIASSIAGSTAHHALVSAANETPTETFTSPALRREVHQATGVILVQLNTSATIAYSRLQAYAFANGRTVQAVARDVVAGNITFDETLPDGIHEGRPR